MMSSPADGWGPLPPHATPRRHRRRRVLRWLERALVAIGVVCLGYYGYVSAEAALYQAWEARELEVILASAPDRAPAPPNPAEGPSTLTPAADDRSASPAASAAPRPAAGSPPPGRPDTEERVARPPAANPSRGAPPRGAVGRIEIPRLGVNAIVRTGSDARTLRLAVGHIPGTALPGQGNTGLAAHRDTFFRRLGSIEEGDEIRVVTPHGTFRYTVEGTQVVEPTDVWVLNPTEAPVLTLVTCYPFRFIGAAPQRFIVRALLTSS